MSTEVESINEIDSVRRRQRRRRRHRQPVVNGFDPTATGYSLDECRFPEIERNVIRTHISRDAATAATSSSMSEDDMDLERGELEMVKVDPLVDDKAERDCRICHLKSDEEEIVIDLGCSCKGDLGTAHKHCAETWFKIRGNTTCEICGSAVTNVAVVVGIIILNQEAAAAASSVAAVDPPVIVIAENGMSWNGRRLMNILLVSVILAFVISWLFHSKLLSSG